MKIELSFSELNAIVRGTADKDVVIRYKDSRTLRLHYKTTILFVDKDVDVNLVINKIAGKTIDATFSSDGFGVETMVKIALAFVEADAYDRNDNRITFYLDKFEKTKSLFKIMEINDFQINENGMVIELVKK